MKRLFTVLLALLLVMGLVACNSDVPVKEEEETAENDTNEETVQEEEKILVAYFSATGNTKEVAEKIAFITGADIYEIKALEEYTEDDLSYNSSTSRTTNEQNDPTCRPAIGSETIDISSYKTVYIGYPIWWGDAPRIMDTFVETYDFEGKTVIPFCTSDNSGIGNSGKDLEALAGSGNWLEGQRFAAGATEDEVRAWIEGLE
ncbi:MAG: flavodoxin [Erysipelotrichaceae bacterium]|nr:flavodoxin [Erysipelotrichaceae bacterium]